MSTQELQIDIHNLIDKVNDNKVLSYIKSILSKQATESSDWWDTIDDDERNDILEAIEQANNEETFSTKEVMSKYKQWL